MKIKSLKKNLTEVHTEKAIILVSYQTPVACYLQQTDQNGFKQGFYKTEQKHSVTTSKHINSWLQDAKPYAQIMPQEWFDNLL